MSNRCLNFTKNLPGTRGPLHSGAPWTLPTLPTPLLRHCIYRVVNARKVIHHLYNVLYNIQLTLHNNPVKQI